MIKSAGDLLQMSAFGLWVHLNLYVLLDAGLLYFVKVVVNIYVKDQKLWKLVKSRINDLTTI